MNIKEVLAYGLKQNPTSINQLVASMRAYSEVNGSPLQTDEISAELLRALHRGSDWVDLPDFELLNHGFTPSKYQHGIFEWISVANGNGMVEGVAGCGKTTTIVEGLKYIPSDKSILLLAFNKHIEIALKAKITQPNVTISTFNAFGWGVCRKNMHNVKLRADKDRAALKFCLSAGLYNRVKGPTLRMISLLKALNYKTTKGWEEVAAKYGVEISDIKKEDDFPGILTATFGASIADTSTMNFDDQIYQPIYRNWVIPNYDFILVDESQDCSPINIETIKRAAGKNGRILLVGDPDQAIYMFRGAHPDAMGTMATQLSTTTLPLSVCYRCPDTIIESAKEEVPRIEAPQPNPRGEGSVADVQTHEFERQVSPGDLVVCRMTHPLIKRCLIQWSKGVKALVKGRDLAEQLFDLIEKIHGGPQFIKNDYASIRNDIEAYKRNPELNAMPKPSTPSDIKDFLVRLSNYITERQADLLERGLDELAAQLEDRQMGIVNLAEDCTHVVQVVVKIETMFTEISDNSVVMFMTGHKCKGLEYDKVWILRPDLCPSRMAKTDAQLKQEKNLMYVMKTRAMKELYFVSKEHGEK